MNATATPTVDRTIRLQDGRMMAYSEWGDLAGRPVILLHGAPGSRLFCPDAAATEAAGVRLITIDRPGYGRSDPRPGQLLVDWPADYVELAKQLDLPACLVIGWSAGGRSALALGLRAPDLVASIGVAAGRGPIDQVPGAVEHLSSDDQAVVAMLAHDRAAGLAAIRRDAAWFTGDGWQTMFANSWGDADDAVLAAQATTDAMKSQFREGARQGSAGLEADDAIAWTPWGFSTSDIRQPVHVWAGGSDPDVNETHAIYLAETIPLATLVSFPGAGHLFPISHWADMLAATT